LLEALPCATRTHCSCASAATATKTLDGLSAEAVYRLVNRHAQAAGVPDRLAHPHALRAYWATHWTLPKRAASGGPGSSIASFFGELDVAPLPVPTDAEHLLALMTRARQARAWAWKSWGRISASASTAAVRAMQAVIRNSSFSALA
jgi:hypothetical protein